MTCTTSDEGREHGSILEGQASSPSLGGVWLHRKTEEDITEYESVDYDDDDEDDRTTFSEDSVPSTPLPQLQDISFFDPLSDSGIKIHCLCSLIWTVEGTSVSQCK